jgi:hypothetical protein
LHSVTYPINAQNSDSLLQLLSSENTHSQQFQVLETLTRTYFDRSQIDSVHYYAQLAQQNDNDP